MKKKNLLIGCLLLTTSYVCNGMQVDPKIIEIAEDGIETIKNGATELSEKIDQFTAIAEKFTPEKLILRGVLPLLILCSACYSLKRLLTNFDPDKPHYKKRTVFNATSLFASMVCFTGWFWMLQTDRL